MADSIGWIDCGLLFSDDPNPLALRRVLLVDPMTGERQLWKEILPRDPAGIMNMGSLVVTPDGRSYCYWRFHAVSDLYLIDGLG
jgi:hypothetical protein